jgi:hypothetical protein
MKSISIGLCIALLIIPIGTIPQVFSIQEEQGTLLVETTLSFSEPCFEEEDSFAILRMSEHASWTLQPGYPQVPVLSQTYILPFGSIISSVEYDPILTMDLFLQKPLRPVPYPNPVSLGINAFEYTMDERIYTQPLPFPEKQYEVSIGTGINDDQHVTYATIRWYPLQYYPSEQKMRYTNKASIRFFYTSPVETTQTNDAYDLLIIAPDEYEQALQPLIIHKETYGVRTVFASVESILAQTRGRDAPEKIKYFIFDTSEDSKITFVLLVGNVDKTPMRRAAIRVYHDDDLLTDLYYADIYDAYGGFSSWDSNNNNRFSEYNWQDGLIDIVDLYPDLHVGRLPCNSTKEVELMVEKIITYETQTYGSEWYKRILLLAGDTFPNHGVIEGEVVTGFIADHMQQYGFEPIKLWTSLGAFRPLNINKEINKGAGFISYSGHGYEQGFGTSPPNVEQRIEYFSPYLYGIFNHDKLPVIFFDACSTTRLDFTVEDLHEWYPTPLVKLFSFASGVSYKMDSLYPTFTWEILNKRVGGGIAAVGSTRVAFTGVDANGAHWGAGLLNTNFYKAYAPGKYLGELMTQTQTDYINTVGKECITLEEFILVGDPSLRLGGYP